MSDDEGTWASGELEMFAINDEVSYNDVQYTIQNTLRRHYTRGVFDPNLAVKGLRHPVDRTAQRFHDKHMGGSGRWHQTFSVADRNAVAARLLESHMDWITGQATGNPESE
jgi:hypothetical protein|tara:strand:- start:52 stop:384 length:333 start_codon:yes stop_codon:yes gene_type:complete